MVVWYTISKQHIYCSYTTQRERASVATVHQLSHLTMATLAEHQLANQPLEEETRRNEDATASSDDDESMEEESLPPPPPPPPPPPTTTTTTPKDPRSRKRRRRDKLFQDCVTIQIPLDVTADLGVAFQRTRRKRVQALTKAFPGLVVTQPAAPTTLPPEVAKDSLKGDTTMEDDDDDDDENKTGPVSPPRKPLSHVPRKEDYANVVDYLEAKYVQGVMLDDEKEPGGNNDEDDDDDDDDDEGQGSVYSQSSFLDDQDLQRGIAEQVLAQSTTTKLELESNNDDAFFVNVGDLEVEQSFMTEEGYDPLQGLDNVKKPKKKRKPAEKKDSKSVTSKSSSTGKEKKKPAAKATTAKGNKTGTPKKKSDASEASDKKAKATTTSTTTLPKKKDKTLSTTAEKAAAAKKTKVDAALKIVVKIVKDLPATDLPRRKTSEKVAITCPADKQPGDSILFANPHVEGQRLKVKIPKKTVPGGTFRVTVPVAPRSEDENDTTDHNKWSREFYDAFIDYCALYDEWIDLVAVVKEEEGDTEYAAYVEKRNKFLPLLKELPKDLKTPLDKAYLNKLLRRARQNRNKRERTRKLQEEKAAEEPADTGENEPSDEKDAPATRQVIVPQLATEFPTVAFDHNHF